MPRENSFSDSDGRSLTPDLEDELEDHRSPPLPLIPRAASTTRGPHQRQAQRPSLDAAGIPLSVAARVQPQTKPSMSTASGTPRRPSLLTPGDRFRSSVRKVIAMRRGSIAISSGRIGAEPGIDPRRESTSLTYGHIRQKCLIEVADYSSVRSSFGRMTNQEFISFLEDERASAKEPWVKVRWINVGGVSWDVISALALKYDMHPLAIEDLLQFRKNARSKADYYPKHLFLRVLCHRLMSDDDTSAPGETSHQSMTHLDATSSALMDADNDSALSWSDNKSFDIEEPAVFNGGSRFSTGTTLQNTVRRRFSSRHHDVERHPMKSPHHQALRMSNLETGLTSRKDVKNLKVIRVLKKGDRVNVKISPMGMFLFRDGTVVTIHRDTTLDFTAPITQRLRQRDTGLRATADASLLVESLLDLVVDQALEVVEAYQSKILKLEQAILLKPNMKHVRRLHILQGDLILHKRTLEPIKTVVYGLRRYDADRVAALSERIDPSEKVQGYMSHKARIYLADVHDHMEYILTSLDMFAGICENLINYTFNMTSYEMNEVMRRLTLATIIFLPLTLLTGYFGMNFENMWTIHHGHTDIVFWIIALPLMSIVLPIFLGSDLQRIWHYMQKRAAARTVKEKYKQA